MYSVAFFASQHLIVFLLLAGEGRRPVADAWFCVVPLRSLVTQGSANDFVVLLAFAYTFLIAWALAALAFRRAADASINEWIAACAIVPGIQIAAILALAVLPTRPVAAAAQSGSPSRLPWVRAAQGLLAGVAATLAAVAVGTLVFHVYGYG